jgi:hypothetical protein
MSEDVPVKEYRGGGFPLVELEVVPLDNRLVGICFAGSDRA